MLSGVKILLIPQNQKILKSLLKDIDELINLKVDVMIIAPVDDRWIVPTVNKLNELNIPIITIDRLPTEGKVESFIRSDNLKGAEQVVDYFEKNGEPCSKIAMIRGPSYCYSAREREEGFIKAAKNRDFEVILSEHSKSPSIEEGYRLMSQLLEEHMDIKAVFSCNDEMALGAIEALKEKGEKLIVLGFSGEKEALEAIEKGEMSGTVVQAPKIIGAVAISTAIKAMKGEKVEADIVTPTSLWVPPSYVESLQSNIEELNKFLDLYSKVLTEIGLGKLSARVDTKQLKGEHKFLGETLNSVISILEYDTNKIKENERELSNTIDSCKEILYKIVQEKKLSARVDVSKLAGKYKIVGKNINQLVDSLVGREEEVKEVKAYAEAIIANLADPLWVVDKEDYWILVNEALKNVTGYKEEEMFRKKNLEQPLFEFFLKIPGGKEKLEELSKKIKAKEHVTMLIPWLTKSNKLLMMSCSGEPLRDTKGNVIGGVFIGKDMSVLQKAGIAATKTLTKKVEAEVGKNYELATFMLMSSATIIAGDSSLEILRGTVEGYNRRFNKNIGIEEGIALTHMPREEWPSFIEFLLSRFYECIGPTTFECSEGIKSIEDIVKKVKIKYGISTSLVI
jgi:ribose transport system substrate-binding protein